ncbi:MAG: fibronectin type III domain-containing protein [Gemmatimonadales bacterium]|nr:fibronectin type III domain-containing protein [Gemmatimonadales bacterium]
MKSSAVFLRSITLAALVGFGAACGDDNPSGPSEPATPTGLAAVEQSDGSIQVTWNAATDATSYTLARTDPSTPGAFTAVGGTLTTTTYNDTDVDAGVVYGYQVSAVNAVGSSAASATVNVTTTGASVATLTGFITANRTLFADTVYTLQGFVQVANNAVLTIQPGTRIEGDATIAGSSLFILRGSQIDAQGTAAAPIVFTSSRAAGSRAPGDWGGLIIVGNGIINRTGVVNTEGPAGIQQNYGGGTGNTSSSGSLRYVRIEFAGFDVSGGGNSELNSLSMYAVGSGTVLEYVESLAGLDDAFEWWGGAVDGRYLVSYESGDDHYDASEGYVGRVQFAIGFQSTRLAPAVGTGVIATDPQGFELDGCAGSGCDLGTRSVPFTNPIFANVTMVGNPAEPQTSGGRGLVLRRGHLGFLSNLILAKWKSFAVSVRDTSVTLAVRDSANIVNIILAENASAYEASSDPAFTDPAFTLLFSTDNHRTAPTAAGVLTNLTPATFDWTPTGNAATGCNTVAIPGTYNTANFFGATLTLPAYCGAVDPAGPKWYEGWTSYATN